MRSRPGQGGGPPAGGRQTLTSADRPGRELWVRVNPGASGLLVDDLEAVVVPGLDGIILPKAESAADVATVDALLGALERSRGMRPGRSALIATIETAAGLGRVDEIAGASPRIACLGFGAGDFSLDLGLDWPPEGGLGHTLLTAKAELVLASRRNGLGAAHDGVFPDFRAPEQLRAEAQAARALGFAGKHAIHPDQLPVIAEVFGASAEQIAEAQAVVDAYEAGISEGRGGVHIDGRFIDAPVAERARRVLAPSPAVRGIADALDRPRAHCLHAHCRHSAPVGHGRAVAGRARGDPGARHVQPVRGAADRDEPRGLRRGRDQGRASRGATTPVAGGWPRTESRCGGRRSRGTSG